MILTLRITSFLAAALASYFLAFPAIFGFGVDDSIKEFLNRPSIIEEFKKADTNKRKDPSEQVSPLVKQAQAFALYLDPPPPPKPKAKSQNNRRSSTSRARPKKVSAKFKLIGTSYYELRPELSLVLIDEPGSGLRWVKQSGGIGHLIVEEIKDGIVVMRDGSRTFEMEPERQPRKSLVRGKKIVSATKRVSEASISGLGRPKAETTAVSELSPAESALMEGFMKKLKSNLGNTSDADYNETDTTAQFGELLSGLEALRVGEEEADKLDELGKELNRLQDKPSRPKLKGRITEREHKEDVLKTVGRRLPRRDK